MRAWFSGRSSSPTGSAFKSASGSAGRRSHSSRHSRESSRTAPRSIFSSFTHHRSSTPSVFSSASSSWSSSRRARPRDGFIKRIVAFLRRLFRRLSYYARRHPAKVFFMVLMPLISSGVLVKLLAMIGIRLPSGFFGDLLARGSTVSSSSPSLLSSLGYSGLRGSGGFQDGLNGLMSVAKMFI